MNEILGFQVDDVAAALWMSLEALIRQRELKKLYAFNQLNVCCSKFRSLF